ncbi:co-chaperone GroES [bacterium]|nr:co-chaperone GroES [bacterium]
MAVKPLADRVLVKRMEEEEQKIGSLYVPDTAKEKPQKAKVISVGPGKTDDNGKLHPPRSNRATGPHLKWGGTEVKIKGEEHLILREDDILGVID